jgi:HPt (histidine-containing phosphotransfer) domain-containing protein
MRQPGHRSSQGIVNLDDLLMRVENDQAFLCELISIFKEEFPPLLQSLQDSVARGDIKNVEKASHGLKGILSGLSVTRAAGLASRIEWMARAGERLELPGALTVLEKEVADLMREVDAYVEEPKL